MKQTRKKILSMLVCAALLLSLVACGSDSAAAGDLSADVVQADVQEYITTIVDSGATITSFSHTQNSISSTEMEVICMVAYSGTGASGTGSFTLSYELVDGVWTLGDLTADFSDAAATVATTSGNQNTAVTNETPAGQPTVTETGDTVEQSMPAIVTTTVENAKILSGYTLEQVGSFQNQKDYVVSFGVMACRNGEGFNVINDSGEVLSDTFYEIVGIGDGYFTVENSLTEVNCTGLITTSGEQLIPCEAAYIEALESYPIGRYLCVTYSTGEVSNSDDAFFSTTDDAGEKTYHSGYTLVYDLEEKHFVDNVKVTYNGIMAVQECGDSFVVEDEEHMYYMYNSAGELLMQTSHFPDVGNGHVIINDSGANDVYDDTGSYLFSSPDVIASMPNSTSGFMKKLINDNWVLIDKNGNQILPDSFDSIVSETYGIVEVKTIAGEEQLINLSGQILATGEYFSEIVPGYYYYEEENGTYAIVSPEGVIVTGLDSLPYSGVVKSGTDIFIYSDQAFTLHLDTENVDRLDTCLISTVSNENGKEGVFDLFTGTQLLEYQFADIWAGDGYIYARQGETWTIYKIVEQYR